MTQYHPAVPNLKHVLLKNWHLIQNQPSLRQIFKEPPLISFKRGKSLKDMLFVCRDVCQQTKKNEQYGVLTWKLSIKFASNVICSTVDILPPSTKTKTARLDNPQEFIYIGMLQVTEHAKEIPGKLPAISTGCQGPVLVAKNLWLVMTLDLKRIIAVKTLFNSAMWVTLQLSHTIICGVERRIVVSYFESVFVGIYLQQT